MRLLGSQYVDRTALRRWRGVVQGLQDRRGTRKADAAEDRPPVGSIVIETTEALTVIDVNSGKFTGGKNLEDTILRTNVEAAAEVARQVRLRDIGGIIVCDFIDMGSEASRSRVIETLEAAARPHPLDDSIVFRAGFARIHAQARRQGPLRSTARALPERRTRVGPLARERRDQSLPGSPPDGREAVHANGKTGSQKHSTIHVHCRADGRRATRVLYEDEMHHLEEELGATVDVVVDSALHPEKTTISRSSENGVVPSSAGVRVGEEVDVDPLHAKLPNPTSALAIVGNKLVEVENAANAVGHSIRIKIIDIDEDGNILAEPRVAVAQASEDASGAVAGRTPSLAADRGGTNGQTAAARRGSRARRGRSHCDRHFDFGRCRDRSRGRTQTDRNAASCGRSRQSELLHQRTGFA